MQWYVYILECGDGTLYTGSTNDPERRLREHSSGSGARYTARRLPVKMVHRVEVADRSAAQKLEYRIKRLTRLEKLDLIAGSRGLPI